jgi:hypothetical protein
MKEASMVRVASLVGLLLVARSVHASDFVPLPISPSAIWLQQIYADPGGYGTGASILAPAGEQPPRLDGALTGGSFSLYADALISATENAIDIDLSGPEPGRRRNAALGCDHPESLLSLAGDQADWTADGPFPCDWLAG